VVVLSWTVKIDLSFCSAKGTTYKRSVRGALFAHSSQRPQRRYLLHKGVRGLHPQHCGELVQFDWSQKYGLDVERMEDLILVGVLPIAASVEGELTICERNGRYHGGVVPRSAINKSVPLRPLRI